MKIPSIIAAFVKAQNDRDSSAVVACFADGAVVHDEGQERRGLVAIKEWSDKGAFFVTGPLDNHGWEWRCYMRDPDGYLIEVGQYSQLALDHFK